MADKIKNMFSYGEQRRTLYLNALNKDDYGRHRAHVLYGLDLSGTGTKVQISPGAVYTSQGQRLFFEVTDREIDIGPATVDAFNATHYPDFPICVLLFLRYQFQVPRVASPIDEATSGPTKADLSARIVPYDRNTCAPAYNLKPVDPVNLDDTQPEAYPHISNSGKPSIKVPSGHSAPNESIQFGEVPLGYVLIGVDPNTNLPAVNLDSAGVKLVTYKNVFEAISDLVGQDVLLPIQATRIVAGLAQTVGSALEQGYSSRAAGAGIFSPSLLNPHYGTPNVNPGDPREESTFTEYREASFLRDGDPMLEAFRRMDVVLRQWMNRTGAQDLVALTKDAAGNVIPVHSELDKLLLKLDGSLDAASPSVDGNANTVLFDNGVSPSVPDPTNHVIKSGLIPHVENTILGKLNTPEGDSHEKAIAALDVGIFNILQRVLGVTVPRSQLRDVTGGSYTPATLDERPEGRPDEPRPTVGGQATLPYITTQNFKQLLTEITNRALCAPGSNLLVNTNFWAGNLISGTAVDLPPFWAGVVGAGISWSRARIVDSITGLVGTQYAATVGLGIGADVHQDIITSITTLGEMLRSASYLSMSMDFQNTGSTSVTAELVGYSDAAATTSVFSLTINVPNGATTGMRLYTATATLDPAITIKCLRWRFKPTVPGEIAQFTFGGLAVNTGMPNTQPSFDRTPDMFMSRFDNREDQQRGDLWLGARGVRNVAPLPATTNAEMDDIATDAGHGGGTGLRAVNARDVNQTFLRRDSAKAMTENLDLGTHKTVNMVAGTVGTDGANTQQVMDEAAARVAADSAEVINRNAAILVETNARIAGDNAIVALLGFAGLRFISLHTVDGSFTAPFAGNYVFILTGGGGGGGGGGHAGYGSSGGGTSGGSGGGAGQTKFFVVTLTLGQVLNFELGLGGTAGIKTQGLDWVTPTYGGVGQNSRIKNVSNVVLCECTGGAGGRGGAGGYGDWYNWQGGTPPRVQSQIVIAPDWIDYTYSGGGRDPWAGTAGLAEGVWAGSSPANAAQGGAGGSPLGKYADEFALTLAQIGYSKSTFKSGDGGLWGTTNPTAGLCGGGGGGGGGRHPFDSLSAGQDGAAGGRGMCMAFLVQPTP